MAQTTIGDSISRIRKEIKVHTKDAFITDRYLFGILRKHARALIKREDSGNKLMRIASLFEAIPFLELEEVDAVHANELNITSGIKIKRTVDILPVFFEGYWGPLIRRVSSIDQSQEIQKTSAIEYAKKIKRKTFKYDKNLYYWFFDGRLYFPKLNWDAVRVEGLFEDDISSFGKATSDKTCRYRQEQNFNIPGYLIPEVESMTLQELGITFNIPQDTSVDKQHILR